MKVRAKGHTAIGSGSQELRRSSGFRSPNFFLNQDVMLLADKRFTIGRPGPHSSRWEQRSIRKASDGFAISRTRKPSSLQMNLPTAPVGSRPELDPAALGDLAWAGGSKSNRSGAGATIASSSGFRLGDLITGRAATQREYRLAGLAVSG